MFHPHPPSSVILVTCFVSLFEMSSHLFMSFRTTSLSFNSILQFHTMSSDKPVVLVIFVNCKIIKKKKTMNTGNSSKGAMVKIHSCCRQQVIQGADSNSIPTSSQNFKYSLHAWPTAKLCESTLKVMITAPRTVKHILK